MARQPVLPARRPGVVARSGSFVSARRERRARGVPAGKLTRSIPASAPEGSPPRRHGTDAAESDALTDGGDGTDGGDVEL